MTAPPINLNKARKAKARAEGEAMASINRAKFGRTKAEKLKATSEVEKAVRALDAHKRER